MLWLKLAGLNWGWYAGEVGADIDVVETDVLFLWWPGIVPGVRQHANAIMQITALYVLLIITIASSGLKPRFH